MRNILYVALLAIFTITSCTTVETGHEAPIVSWGGKTDMSKTLSEGIHWGFNYIWDETPEYDIREQTFEYEVNINDKNDMKTPIKVIVYFKPIAGKSNYIHSTIGPDYKDVKLRPFIESSVGKVIPQFSAQEINKTKRAVVEQNIVQTLKSEAASIYVDIQRVQLAKVGIPNEVARLAEETAVQLGRNELAEKKEAEKVALAKAQVAEAQGNFEAAELEAKTRDLLSQPKMLELQRVENEKIMWQGYMKHGKSPFGENNFFSGAAGGNPMVLLNK